MEGGGENTVEGGCDASLGLALTKEGAGGGEWRGEEVVVKVFAPVSAVAGGAGREGGAALGGLECEDEEEEVVAAAASGCD